MGMAHLFYIQMNGMSRSQGCDLLDNADGTGSTLLDNAGAIILSILS